MELLLYLSIKFMGHFYRCCGCVYVLFLSLTLEHPSHSSLASSCSSIFFSTCLSIPFTVKFVLLSYTLYQMEQKISSKIKFWLEYMHYVPSLCWNSKILVCSLTQYCIHESSMPPESYNVIINIIVSTIYIWLHLCMNIISLIIVNLNYVWKLLRNNRIHNYNIFNLQFCPIFKRLGILSLLLMLCVLFKYQIKRSLHSKITKIVLPCFCRFPIPSQSDNHQRKP